MPQDQDRKMPQGNNPNDPNRAGQTDAPKQNEDYSGRNQNDPKNPAPVDAPGKTDTQTGNQTGNEPTPPGPER